MLLQLPTFDSCSLLAVTPSSSSKSKNDPRSAIDCPSIDAGTKDATDHEFFHNVLNDDRLSTRCNVQRKHSESIEFARYVSRSCHNGTGLIEEALDSSNRLIHCRMIMRRLLQWRVIRPRVPRDLSMNRHFQQGTNSKHSGNRDRTSLRHRTDQKLP